MHAEEFYGDDDDLLDDEKLFDQVVAQAKTGKPPVQQGLWGNKVILPKASTSKLPAPNYANSKEKAPVLKVIKKWDRSTFAKQGWGKSKKKGKKRARDSDDEEDDEEAGFEESFDGDDPDLDPNMPAPAMQLVIDSQEAKSWIYPTNKSLRDYQFNISKRALFNNVLCSLPTGLGKTFIAAVVMLNYYRWFPKGKIIFMAPTRPLVAQQIEACHSIAGIPASDAAEMTGQDHGDLRAQAWQHQRVFYCTPQTVMNDLRKGRLDPLKVVCIVVDEAHKATGDYAYCAVVRYLMTKNPHFRILALTATPGSKPEDVQGVVDALHIGHIVVRTDASMDIQQYMHRKETEIMIVELPPDFVKIRDAWAKIMDGLMNPLIAEQILFPQKAIFLHPFTCQQANAKLRGNKAAGWAWGFLSLLGDLARGMDYLLTQSLSTFAHTLDNIKAKGMDDGKAKSKAANIVNSAEFKSVYRDTQHLLNAPGTFRHPKMEILQNQVLSHFQKHFAAKTETRVMVFSQFRDVVEEIVDVLNNHKPMIKATRFVGQGADKKGGRGFSQKEQLQTIKDFKEGKYNVLVATSIGEEGLDIGEVDVIYCYEASKSPIRMLQRVGRTGRARDGKIVVLMTKDREDRNWDKAKSGYEDVQNAIVSGKAFELYSDCDILNPNKATIECVKKTVEVLPFKKDSIGLTHMFGTRAVQKRAKEVKDPKRNMPKDLENHGFRLASDKPVKKIPTSDEVLVKRRVAALLSTAEFDNLEKQYVQRTVDYDGLFDHTQRPITTSDFTGKDRIPSSAKSKSLCRALDLAKTLASDTAACTTWEQQTFANFKFKKVLWWSSDERGTSSRLYRPVRPMRTRDAPLDLALARGSIAASSKRQLVQDSSEDDDDKTPLEKIVETRDTLQYPLDVSFGDDADLDAAIAALPVPVLSVAIKPSTLQTARSSSVEPILEPGKSERLTAESSAPKNDMSAMPATFTIPGSLDSSDEEMAGSDKDESELPAVRRPPRISDVIDDSLDEAALAEFDQLYNAPAAAIKPERDMPPPIVPDKRKTTFTDYSRPEKVARLSLPQSTARKVHSFKAPFKASPALTKEPAPIDSSSPAVVAPGGKRNTNRQTIVVPDTPEGAGLQPPAKGRLQPMKDSQEARVHVERQEPRLKAKSNKRNKYIANSQAEDSDDAHSDSSVCQSSEDSQDRKFVAGDDSIDGSMNEDAYRQSFLDNAGAASRFKHSPIRPGAYKMRYHGGANTNFFATQRRSSSPMSDYQDGSGVCADDASIVYDTP